MDVHLTTGSGETSVIKFIILRAHPIFISQGGASQQGTISGAGGIGSLIRKKLGEFSVFGMVRLELSRPILDLLDTVKLRRMCS